MHEVLSLTLNEAEVQLVIFITLFYEEGDQVLSVLMAVVHHVFECFV